MDDFLHNLRSGKLKHQDRGRRDYSDYKGPQRRAGNERRRTDYYTKVTNENFAMIKESLELLTESQKRVGDSLLALEQSGARIAEALETILGRMNDQMVRSNEAPSLDRQAETEVEDEPVPPQTAVTAKDDSPPTRSAVGKLSDNDIPKMLKIISSMRDEKKSWEKIARHIDDLDIPTVSGKGKWRGQAIKKFYDANS